MTMQVGGTSGLTFPDASTQNTAATGFGFKNRLINGSMGNWQYSTSWTGTSTGGPSGYTTADRWVFYSLSSMTASLSTSAPSGFQYALKIQRPNASSTTNQIQAYQVVESANMFDLAGQPVTLSFWAKAGANFSGSALSVQIYTGTVADQGSALGLGGWTGSATPLDSTAALTTTWTKYTYTTTIAANALELDVVFGYIPTGTAGADDSFYVTGVQLEKGSTATDFDYRPVATEVILCQRYTEVSLVYVSTTGYPLYYKVTKRTAPTVSGGGAGFSSGGVITIQQTYIQQTTGAFQTLIFNAEL